MKKAECLERSKRRFAAIRYLRCGCPLDDDRRVFDMCGEHGDLAGFPQPDGSVAFVARNDVDLAMVFTKHTYDRQLSVFLRARNLDAA